MLWTKYVSNLPIYKSHKKTNGLCSIEANCVLIGACIPTLYPLIVRIFGVSALGGTVPFYQARRPPRPPRDPTGEQLHVLTIGSHSMRKKPTADELESVDGNDSGDAVRGVTYPASAYSGTSGRVSGSEVDIEGDRPMRYREGDWI
ncbi:hypothetical protein jhhlp_002941 [Lomentospora prolificans]|uniref:Uncharacterized protein n=1 Tax=Lomentospora prolificans TaxID=41688 RepID=A0A2N3NFG2_9PEZI|nr:hypothetical protein jhhlp_002941 [Lomentospora prolificans]